MPALHQTKALLGLLGWRRQIGPASAFLFCRSSNKEVPKYGKSWQPGEITLRCNECKQRNYNTIKNKKNDPDRLELNKYCPFCRKHTVHTETK